MGWSEWAPGEPGAGGGALRVAQASLLVMALSMPFSIAVTEGSLILGLVALFVSRWRGRAFRTPETYLWPAAFAMLACWLLSTALSEHRLESLFHVRKLYAMGLILLAAECARDPRVRRRVIPSVLAGALFTAGIGLLIYAIRVPSKPDYRLQSVLSNQMTSGGVLSAALLWALAAFAAGPWRRRWAYGAIAIPLAIALALTQTRSHWLGTVVGAAVIVIALAPRWWWTVPATAALGVWLAPHRLAMRIYSIVDPHEPGNQGRLSMWRSARDIIREHPMFGVGCQDLLALYRRYRYPDWTFESGHFHNNFIQITVMTGFVGLVAFLFWLAAAGRELVRGMRSAHTPEDRGIAAGAAAIFAALLVSGLFDYTFGDAEVVYHTFLGLGLALALLPPREAHSTHGA
jgi:O-antigen ligase